ncbi:hypothetical protein Hanom_Chr15g01384821 [Helianthus anomalus]
MYENAPDLTEKMNGVNEPDKNSKISNLLDPYAKKQTFRQKLQNWSNLRDKNDILHFIQINNILVSVEKTGA